MFFFLNRTNVVVVVVAVVVVVVVVDFDTLILHGSVVQMSQRESN